MVNNINKTVFMVGIGGVSMSSIARTLFNEGHNVLGSDETKCEITEELEKLGIQVFYGHKKSNLGKLLSATIIYSSAISDTNVELVEAKNRGFDVLKRTEALDLICSSFNSTICVAGSHGKTTTTNLLSHFLKENNKSFCAHIGGKGLNFGSCFVDYGSFARERIVLESCEYKDNFLFLNPSTAIILNTSYDHVDYFTTYDSLVNSFIAFSNKVKAGGKLILNLDDKASYIIKNKTTKNKNIVTFSLKDKSADYYLKVKSKTQWGYNVVVYILGREYNINTNIDARYNLYNFLGALTVYFEEVGALSEVDINKIINSFKGTSRRYENIGKINGASVISDYAHHPEEIAKVITRAKVGLIGKLYVVFQPHTFTRTKAFWAEFIKSLSLADRIVLYPIYKAREKAIRGVTSYRLAKDIRRLKKNCYYAESYNEIINYLGYFVTSKDKVLLLGAGDIDNLRKNLN